MSPPHLWGLLLAVAALFAPATAHAHLVTTGLGPFYDGISHFAVNAADLLPTVTVALLGGQRGAAAGRMALFTVPSAWFLGGSIGLTLPGVSPHASSLIAPLSLVALGPLVAAAARLRPSVVLGIAASFGLVHGYVSGSEMRHAGLGAPGLIGVVAAVFVSVAIVAAAVTTTRMGWGRVAVRVAGSWTAAIGLLWLGWAIRGR